MARAEPVARRLAAWLGAAALAAMAAPTAAPAALQATPAFDVLTFRTVPAIAGVRIRSAGRTVRTDGSGFVTLRVRRTGPGYTDIQAPEVLPTRLRSGKQARFGGLFQSGRTLGISLYTRTRLRFVDPAGKRVPARRITGGRLASGIGARIHIEGAVTPLLQASRVLLTIGGVRSRPIEYAVDRVEIDGANVVNRAQRRFFPLRAARLSVPLLLYSARFVATDALFGGHVGTAVRLRYPGGRTVRLPLRNGTASAASLARGQYYVRAEAPGYSIERPLWLSRDQVVELRIIGYLDIALLLGALSAVALGLLLARRPVLRRRLRRVAMPVRRARPVTDRR